MSVEVNMYERSIIKTILTRLSEPKIQILLGARQVGKTTLIQQALKKVTIPFHYIIAESGYTTSWIEQQWAYARALATSDSSILVIDEIQKIGDWSERVKRLFDEDTISNRKVHVVLLGSSSLLLQKGLSESMAGRFEIIPISHWTFAECQEAFDLTLEEFIYFGGYPGALRYKNEESRFHDYLQDSIIEPVVSRDILSQNLITKPALLRELFRLGCEYSSQILAFNKMLGQLQDAGNTTTLSHYLNLLDQAYVLKGIHKYTSEAIRQRQSSPKLQVYNTALQTATHKKTFKDCMSDTDVKGRLIESCIGAYILSHPNAKVFYWREDNQEVDFIVQLKGKTIAIEVKSGKKLKAIPGLELFSKKYGVNTKLLVGTGGVPIDVFLKTPLEHFI
jgi:predicted AAA+ superfamily ATPase